MAASILIVDPQQLVRNLLARAFRHDNEFVEIVEAESYAEALGILAERQIQIVLSEIVIKGASGFDLIKKAKQEHDCRCVLLTALVAEELEVHARQAGALALVHKSQSFETLLRVLRQVKTGSPVEFPKAAAVAFQSELPPGPSRHSETDPLNALTPREKEVFHLLTGGLKNVDIAKQLYISTRTVETHRARLSKKLKLTSSIDLIRYALKHGLTQL